MNTHFTFAEYQQLTAKTALYPYQGEPIGLCYCALKLAGEAGEVGENVGKAIRDDGLKPDGQVLPERREKIKKELGDVLWYVSQMATELGYSMAEIAEANIAKLQGRAERGTLHGDGDDR